MLGVIKKGFTFGPKRLHILVQKRSLLKRLRFWALKWSLLFKSVSFYKKSESFCKRSHFCEMTSFLNNSQSSLARLQLYESLPTCNSLQQNPPNCATGLNSHIQAPATKINFRTCLNSRSLAKLDRELFKKYVLWTKVSPFTKGLTFYKRTRF